jgi:hypothetical protein
MPVSAFFTGKDADVEDLLIEGQGKAGHIFGFEPEVGTQAHGWMAFSIG